MFLTFGPPPSGEGAVFCGLFLGPFGFFFGFFLAPGAGGVLGGVRQRRGDMLKTGRGAWKAGPQTGDVPNAGREAWKAGCPPNTRGADPKSRGCARREWAARRDGLCAERGA